MSFDKVYAVIKNKVELYIGNLLSELNDYPHNLSSAMKYALSGGGKRMRPILFLQMLETFEVQESESAIKFACAIECFHNYSLVHDDLPSMDNDDFRRGRPTCHKVYGEATAILTGDALLNLGYELLFEAVQLSGYSRAYTDAAKIMADAIGYKGMIAGQMIDVSPEKEDKIAASVLNYIYQHKTCDFITACILAGATIGGATKKELKHLKEFGDSFGFAFQVRDDLLDIGEPIGEGQFNYVKMYGEKTARKTLGESVGVAIGHLNFIDRDTSFFNKLALKSIERKE